MSDEKKTVLSMRHINKTFPGVKALSDAQLTLREGEIHALMGENGAGKSTLIKVLTGVEEFETGEIIMDGKSIINTSPQEAGNNGISTVYQEVNLCPNLTVAENIFIGREPMKMGRIDWKTMNTQAQKILDNLELEIDATQELENYSVAIQQMVAIARAVDIQSKVLILDEPTSSLDEGEVEKLFKVMNMLKKRGTAIVFVTHFLEQVYAVCDRITVLRNGHFVGEYKTEELPRFKLVATMMGKEFDDLADIKGSGTSSKKQSDEVVIEAKGLYHKGTIMGRGIIPTNHELYYGNIGMHGNYAANQAVNDCDLLISIGTRFNDRITGKLGTFASDAKIIHIDIDTAAISKNVTVDVPLVGDAKEAIALMLSIAENEEPCKVDEWLSRMNEWHEQKPLVMEEKEKLVPKQVIDAINEYFDEPIVTTDVGQNQMWTTQFLELYGRRQMLTSGGLGTMGYGLPAAIGAAIGNPGREVVCVSGDGGFQMNSQEIATAVIQELPITICILNNGYLGMVRQWQDLFYDKAYAGTCLRRRKSCEHHCDGDFSKCPPYTPDFVKLAESYGAQGIRVFKKEEIIPAFEKAKAKTDGPTIIEFIIENEELVMPMVKPNGSITDLIMERGEE